MTFALAMSTALDCTSNDASSSVDGERHATSCGEPFFVYAYMADDILKVGFARKRLGERIGGAGYNPDEILAWQLPRSLFPSRSAAEIAELYVRCLPSLMPDVFACYAHCTRSGDPSEWFSTRLAQAEEAITTARERFGGTLVKLNSCGDARISPSLEGPPIGRNLLFRYDSPYASADDGMCLLARDQNGDALFATVDWGMGNLTQILQRLLKRCGSDCFLDACFVRVRHSFQARALVRAVPLIGKSAKKRDQEALLLTAQKGFRIIRKFKRSYDELSTSLADVAGHDFKLLLEFVDVRRLPK